MTPGQWRTSSRSQGSGGNCVKTRLGALELPQIGDSKLPDSAAVLELSSSDYRQFLLAIKQGQFTR
ncbi:DUF397 domain-containing protein [Phytomonospora endophytica]|uniref:DUF397 domain-containing protein n=2 Tax=Phytomonospora endophytica TaxID=714109 RepID=A0A841G1M6_9ACTN|nr:hypothetical protein [Phytomonospora endophytica]GIG69278.1 hypothetical protein Pen01_55730 [Phytomonospora endophytica]